MPRATLGGVAGTALLVLAALATVTLGSRPGDVVPDLVLPVVVAGALLRGASGGLLLGLLAGWLVDLMPPGSAVLGSSAFVYAAAGLLAGAARREGVAPLGWVGLVAVAATAAVEAGRLCIAVLAGAPVDWSVLGMRAAATAILCALATPLLVRSHHRLLPGRAA